MYVCVYVVLTKEPKKSSVQSTQHTPQKHKDKRHEQWWGFWNLLCGRGTPTDDDQVNSQLVHVSGRDN